MIKATIVIYDDDKQISTARLSPLLVYREKGCDFTTYTFQHTYIKDERKNTNND